MCSAYRLRSADDGATIGRYVLHFAGGGEASLDIVFGSDVRDWWKSTDETKDLKTASVAWTGANPAADAAGTSVRLFKRTYDNPKPDEVIESVDFVSTKGPSAPFLIALTTEE